SIGAAAPLRGRPRSRTVASKVLDGDSRAWYAERGTAAMATESEAQATASPAATVIIPSCTERDFFETIFPYHRLGTWACVYCGEPIEYTNDRTVYIGRRRLACRVEEIGGFFQLCPLENVAAAVNRCCSDRIARADDDIPLGRVIACPI